MGSHSQPPSQHTDLTMPPLSTNVLVLLVLGSAIALPDLLRTARQVVFEGFPEGVPDLTPLGVKLSLEAMFGPAGEMSAIPGEAGVDYPVYNEVPDTGFDCAAQSYPGFYTDPEADCQSFYMCPPGGDSASFLCPNGTVFNQQYFVCDWWYNIDCAAQPSFYGLNALLYQEPEDDK